jgi:hypothetical protein
MKKFQPKHLPLGVLCAGVLGALLRIWLYASGTDEKGLLIPSHPGNILIWVLTATVIVLVMIACQPLKEANKFRFNFPASVTSAVGCSAAAVGIFVDALGHFGGDTLQTTAGILGFLSTAALLFIGFCRLKGRYPSVLFNGLISLYLMLTLVGLYRTWSASPQLQDYVFPLLACVFVMLGCYHDAAFAAHAGSRRRHTFCHMLAVFFCLVSLPRNENQLFYLSLAAWMLTGHCNLTPMVCSQLSADPVPLSEAIPEEATPVAEETAVEIPWIAESDVEEATLDSEPQENTSEPEKEFPEFDFATLQEEALPQAESDTTAKIILEE